MSELNIVQPKVAIIGGGPAGLSAATKLAPALSGEVVVYDREKNAGGIPRHANHPGYGIRDRKRFMNGPSYAKALVRDALDAGVKLQTQTMITGWHDDETLLATSPKGRFGIRPEVFVFATGARERPRPARLIPGDRSSGIYTTGQLQNLVHLHHKKVGTRAVIVGAELVSWSAVMTLRDAGCKTEALISEFAKGESYATFRLGGKVAFQTQVVTRSKVVAIHGRPRVSGVEIENLDTGERSTIACDTVVFTGDWIPDNELLRMRGVELDPNSLSPKTDQFMHTSVPGVFTVGNLNHPVETADVVALEGQYVARRVLEYLAGMQHRLDDVPLVAGEGLQWLAPSNFAPGGPSPARDRLVAWTTKFSTIPTVTVKQAGRVIAKKRLAWPAAPGRAFRIPSGMLDAVNVNDGEVIISLD